jgi:integrase
MPLRPRQANLPPQVDIDPKHPFEKLAVELRDRVYAGDLAIGLPIPSAKELAREHGLSSSTAQRAVQLLGQWGLVRIEPGMPTLVTPRMAALSSIVPTEAPSDSDDKAGTPQALELEIRRLGVPVATLRTQADPDDGEALHRLLLGAVRRHGCQPSDIDEFELIVRERATKRRSRRMSPWL